MMMGHFIELNVCSKKQCVCVSKRKLKSNQKPKPTATTRPPTIHRPFERERSENDASSNIFSLLEANSSSLVHSGSLLLSFILRKRSLGLLNSMRTFIYTSMSQRSLSRTPLLFSSSSSTLVLHFFSILFYCSLSI